MPLYNSDKEAADALSNYYQELKKEIAKVIVGQEQTVELLLTSIFSQGHCLLIGVPGLAKTLLISTLSQVLDLGFSRIQFTPDLMPSDIVGAETLDKDRNIKFVKGAIFSNIILADEINRTPPKTQAALLESMQEYSVTIAGIRHDLPRPFFVLATQNPIEQEGTYPLPEAQLDRFMCSVYLGSSTKIMKYWNNGEYNWLNSGEVANFPIVGSELKISEEAIKKSATDLMPKGTVLLSITRHLRVSILAIDACANQSVVGILENDFLLNSYIYPYLKDEIPRLMSLRSGAQQPHINKNIVDTIEFIIPKKNILNEYYKIATPLYEKININALQNQQLTELRDFLLPMLMNGQVVVK